MPDSVPAHAGPVSQLHSQRRRPCVSLARTSCECVRFGRQIVRCSGRANWRTLSVQVQPAITTTALPPPVRQTSASPAREQSWPRTNSIALFDPTPPRGSLARSHTSYVQSFLLPLSRSSPSCLPVWLCFLNGARPGQARPAHTQAQAPASCLNAHRPNFSPSHTQVLLLLVLLLPPLP